MEPVPATGRSAVRPVKIGRPATGRLIFFFLFFYTKIFKFLVDLQRVFHKMPKDQFVEAEYIGCDHREEKFATGTNYRPAGYR
jgi:hypothetical protein